MNPVDLGLIKTLKLFYAILRVVWNYPKLMSTSTLTRATHVNFSNILYLNINIKNNKFI